MFRFIYNLTSWYVEPSKIVLYPQKMSVGTQFTKWFKNPLYNFRRRFFLEFSLYPYKTKQPTKKRLHKMALVGSTPRINDASIWYEYKEYGWSLWCKITLNLRSLGPLYSSKYEFTSDFTMSIFFHFIANGSDEDRKPSNVICHANHNNFFTNQHGFK